MLCGSSFGAAFLGYPQGPSSSSSRVLCKAPLGHFMMLHLGVLPCEAALGCLVEPHSLTKPTCICVCVKPYMNLHGAGTSLNTRVLTSSQPKYWESRERELR